MNPEVLNSDSMVEMKKFPDKFFDLAIVDPPYGIGECASRNNTGNRSTEKWRSPAGKKYKPFNDSIPYQEHEYLELCRVSKNQIIWGANNFPFLPASTGWIVWDKCVSELEHLSMCELAYSSFDIRCKKFTYLWAGFKREGNNGKKEIRTNHPTQKPVALYKWLLKNYGPKYQSDELEKAFLLSRPRFKILDTHLGSGSSRIAAHDMGFDFWGYEIDKDYFEAQEKRFKNHIAQLTLSL